MKKNKLLKIVVILIFCLIIFSTYAKAALEVNEYAYKKYAELKTIWEINMKLAKNGEAKTDAIRNTIAGELTKCLEAIIMKTQQRIDGKSDLDFTTAETFKDLITSIVEPDISALKTMKAPDGIYYKKISEAKTTNPNMEEIGLLERLKEVKGDVPEYSIGEEKKEDWEKVEAWTETVNMTIADLEDCIFPEYSLFDMTDGEIDRAMEQIRNSNLKEEYFKNLLKTGNSLMSSANTLNLDGVGGKVLDAYNAHKKALEMAIKVSNTITGDSSKLEAPQYSGADASGIVDTANDFINRGANSTENTINMGKVAPAFTEIGQLLSGIAVIVLLVVIGIMGIKFMLANPEQRAGLQKQLIGLIISAVVIFGAYMIWTVSISVMSGATGSPETVQTE